MAKESSSDRAESVSKVVATTAGEDPTVKAAALAALGAPGRSATDIVWILLVSGLIVLLVLALLGLAHVIGTGVADDKMVTVFTTVLAGLLGLFVKAPSSSGKD